jgi:hypothetical protein
MGSDKLRGRAHPVAKRPGTDDQDPALLHNEDDIRRRPTSSRCKKDNGFILVISIFWPSGPCRHSPNVGMVRIFTAGNYFWAKWAQRSLNYVDSEREIRQLVIREVHATIISADV